MVNEYLQQSFYNIFEFSDMMLDAIDGGIVFEDCKMVRNISVDGEILLAEKDTYEAVWFLFDQQVFQFVKRWVQDPEDRPNNMIPGEGSLDIPQKDLAPFLHWCLSDAVYAARKSKNSI